MTTIRRFIIANDHAGVEAKQEIIKHLEDKYQIIDLGTNDENVRVDYPIYAFKAAEMSKQLECEAILICGSGEGMCIAANKIPGIRAALIYNKNVARLVKEHNNANVICFGAREFSNKQIIEMLDAFLDAKFLNEQHKKRIDLIYDYEKK